LWSDPGDTDSDLVFYSNDEFHVYVDHDNNDDAEFRVYNGPTKQLVVQEDGDLLAANNLYLDFDGGTADIYATASGGADLRLIANDDMYAYIDYDGGSEGCFEIRDRLNFTLFQICEGSKTSVGTSATAVETSSGPRKMYTMGSTGLWFEDFGSANLVEGKVTVGIDGLFAETVNLQAGYHVYLTPRSSEAVLLFVTAETPTAFEVQGVTLDGSPASISFDYHIVAKRLGYEELRLEVADSLLRGDDDPDEPLGPDPGPGSEDD
jgi:hypothetical protein